MASKLAVFLIVLNLLVCCSASGRVKPSNVSVLRTTPNTFVLVSPKQVQYLEATVRRFLTNVAVPPNGPIVLRSASPNAKDLQLTIREICGSIRKKLMEFAMELELDDTVQRFEHGLKNIPLSEDWYTELMLQNAYMIRDLGNIINEIGSSMDRYFGKEILTSQRNKQLARQSNSFKFLGVVHDAADFSESLTQCLLQLADLKKSGSSFNLNERIVKLARDPPKIVLKTLKTNLNNISNVGVPKDRAWQQPWHVFLCLSMMKNGAVNYDDCIREMQHVETCLKGVQERRGNGVKSGDVKSWTRAIRRLSDCEIRVDKNADTEVACKTTHRIPRSVKQKIKYILEKALDKEISNGSPFHEITNELADTLSKSAWGLKLVDELCQYVGIYEDGKIKLRKVSMLKRKDEEVVARHRDIARALNTYKRGVLLRTFDSIKRIHRSANDFEKLLAQGVKATFNEAWNSHMNILSCMMDWMNKLLELHSSENYGREDESTSQEEFNGDEDSNSGSSNEFRAVARSRLDIARDVDHSMSRLMESMNRMSKHRRANDNSMLTCIANNLLLVTILMETIGFVSTLFCFGQNEGEQHFDDEWKRARRSLLLLEEERIIDIVSSKYLPSDFSDNSSTPFPSGND